MEGLTFITSQCFRGLFSVTYVVKVCDNFVILLIDNMHSYFKLMGVKNTHKAKFIPLFR